MSETGTALQNELEQLQRGGKQLGRVVDKLADLMRTTVMDGIGDPYGALIDLADWLGEADGMTAEEHAVAVAALRRESRSQRQAGEVAAVLEQVRAAHLRCDDGSTAFGGPHPWCGTCKVAWPCPTVQSLSAPLSPAEPVPPSPVDPEVPGGAGEALGLPEPLLDPDCRDGKHGSCVGGPCECGCHQEARE